MNASLLKKRVDDILADPTKHEWTVQGFGFIRCYLDRDRVQRLNIWDPTQATDEVSTIHDHPWDFGSRIIYGTLHNQRFVSQPSGELYNFSLLKPGEGGHLIGTPGKMRLNAQPLETYNAGDTYSQTRKELHESTPEPGCVTVITRQFHEQDIATVCWRAGEWVSAEPRPATLGEIAYFVSLVERTR